MSMSEIRTGIDVLHGLSESTFKRAAVIGFKGSQGGVQKFSPWHDHDVEARGELIVPKNLSYQSFSSVSLNRPTESFRRRDSQAADVLLVG
jgi:hypothetical protein